MENTIADGVGELDGTPDCTPPMAALSPSSFATVVQDVAHTFGNAWEATFKSCSPVDAGRIEIDEYRIDTVNIEDIEETDATTMHEVVPLNQLSQYAALNDNAQQVEAHREPLKYAGPSAASSCGLIPATSAFEGDWGFDVSCASQTKSTKSVSWTYNETRRKLFANMGVVCPFQVSVTKPPPEGAVVRVMAVYAQPDDARHVVKRCLVHKSEIDKDNHDQNAPCDHLIRCLNPTTQYHEDKATGRHSITVLYEKPDAEMRHTVYHLRFMCLSSCNTGINRRGVKLVWTLEYNGRISGRQVIDLKLCACPGRDRKNEEKVSFREMSSSLLEGITGGSVAHSVAKNPSHLSANTSFNQTRPQKRGLMSVATVITGGITGAPAKIRKTDQEPEGEYVLKCSNKKIYNMLKFIRDSTMVYSKMNPTAWKSSQGNGDDCSPPMSSAKALVDKLDAAARPGCSSTSPTSTANQLAGMKMEDSTDITSGPGALQCWLESIGLPTCFPVLLEKGIRDMNGLRLMNFKTLKRLRLRKQQEDILCNAIRDLSYDEEDEELFPSQELPGAQSQGTLSQGSTADLSQQSCTSTSSARQYRVTRIRVIQPIPDHDYS
uniref:Cellular tumor antigen p53-like n=1 Tax=Rhipicephalus zambeziensis TaxID=60191 RepID=A0A224YVL2_9ACAR